MTNLRAGLRELPERARTASRLVRQTGLLWALTRAGFVELARTAMAGSQNPSRIYRVHARNSPDKLALVWRDQRLTWAELDDRIDRLAAGFRRRGIGRKRSVITMMHNRPEFIEVGAAAARVGAAAVSVSYRSTAHELAYLANHSGASGIVLEPELLHVIDEARASLSPELLANVLVVGDRALAGGKGAGFATTPLEALLDAPAGHVDIEGADDAAVVVYTSGTTGKPKGAVRKFPKEAIQAAMRFINETPLRVDDVHLVTCPLYHSTAFGFVALAHLLGNTAVLMDEWKPELFLRTVERFGITTTAVVPTMLYRLMNDISEETRARYDTRSLRVVFTGGAALSGPLAREFMDAFGDILFNFYGATETGLVTLAAPADLRAAPGTIGRALPGNDIRLLDDDKRDVAPGEVGELFVKNAMLVAGYHRDETATRSSMVDGWFSVGDLARRDVSGHYFIEGRKRDLIISGGVNVYPAEVEAVLEQHPDVGEVAIVGVPDEEWGERVRAYVVPRAGVALDAAALTAFARERLASPKVPRDVVLVDALPRNPTGKVLKRELRERGTGSA